ncbi:MAG: hypothetical protein HKO88_01510 [Xanthomonadales bacterium]|nr:hypothetical protein [Xanthomonadales bacterium]
MKTVLTSCTSIALVLTGLLTTIPGMAEWSSDPTARTPVVKVEHLQYWTRLVKVDDGFITLWQDKRRDNTHVDVYAQKFTLDGQMLWPENGRVIAAGPAGSLTLPFQLDTSLVHDGNGGALISWNDASDPVYFQAFASRVAPDGGVSWGNPGETIQSSDTAIPLLASETRGINRMPSVWNMAADSEGGAFVPLTTGIGRLDSSGRVRTNWFEDPTDQQSPAGFGFVPFVDSAQRDGVYAVWPQGSLYFVDKVVARKLIDPEARWPLSKDTFTDAWGQLSLYDPDYSINVCRLTAVPDDDGGFIAVWTDDRVRSETAHFRVYAQRVDADGNALWQQGGIEVSADVMTYTCYWWSRLSAVADGEGGVAIAWNDQQDSQRLQRIAADGSKRWGADGVLLDTDNGIYTNLTTHGLVQTRDGDYVVLYYHEGETKLVTQKLSGGRGMPLWGEGKVVYEGCVYPYLGGDDAAMVADGKGGAVVTFVGCDQDVYAHRIDDSGAGTFSVNPGLNDAWYDPETSGQGFFITVFPDLGTVSLAWFTYDTELPPPDAVAYLGDPGHRWLTAVGPIEGSGAVMDIELTSGGIFDAATEITRTDPPGSDGTLTLTFSSCNSGTIEYDIPSINRQGIVPIQRVATDNVVICEALSSD